MTVPSKTMSARSERVRELGRFLITGLTNTVVGYVLFAGVQYLLGRYVTYIGSLLIAHLLSSLIAFVLYRKYVFRASGGVVGQFARFQTVYIVPLCVNILLLPVLVQLFAVNVYLAQACSTVVIAIGSYFAHKYFSFRPRVTKSSMAPDPTPRSR
ncbi:hypothetical protein GCM10023065_08250 [Microbacterium laevaniformans]|uniref:GtrA family protein n=1 Tax=Microbacterium laevaniformans TaxID=36807 RepID=UPI00195627CA|nr:GtrA family protein [Microbacterium laevaniformans]MBM7751777.1 putative flippase GtrA [Microbacterium laevaniformans]GLJ63869.1 hypothetical protein GCM10017578_07570 [Microbacterium laevaniformans]